MSVVHRDAAAADPAPGWRARLELEFQLAQARTRLARRRHEGPLLVQKALYPEPAALLSDDRGTVGPGRAGEASGSQGHGSGGPLGNLERDSRPSECQPRDRRHSTPCHVYLIHPPGGIASGDRLELDVALRPGSHALLTTPAAGKYYRRGAAGNAHVTQTFDVEHAVLEWLPQESIYYPNASVQLRSIVNLSRGARFIGWEIGCLGLPACNLSLEAGELGLDVELWSERTPLIVERLRLSGASLRARWGMAGRTAFGTALLYPAGRRELDAANACAAVSGADAGIACTLVDGVLACRGLAVRTDVLKMAFVALWRGLRPLIVGREAVAPRIWAT